MLLVPLRNLRPTRNLCSSIMSRSKVVLFGDSLTQQGYSEEGCWVSLLSDALQRKCDVINRGFSGYTTRNFRQLITKIATPDLFTPELACVVLFLGTNDSNVPHVVPSTHQHVPLDEFKENMKTIISQILEMGIESSKCVIIPPPPCDPEKWKKAGEIKYGKTPSGFAKTNEFTKEYYNAAHDIAKSLDCDFVRHWDQLGNHSECFADGLHFSKVGSKIFFECLWPHIRDKCPTEQQLPQWNEVNPPPTGLLE